MCSPTFARSVSTAIGVTFWLYTYPRCLSKSCTIHHLVPWFAGLPSAGWSVTHDNSARSISPLPDIQRSRTTQLNDVNSWLVVIYVYCTIWMVCVWLHRWRLVLRCGALGRTISLGVHKVDETVSVRIGLTVCSDDLTFNYHRITRFVFPSTLLRNCSFFP